MGSVIGPTEINNTCSPIYSYAKCRDGTSEFSCGNLMQIDPIVEEFECFTKITTYTYEDDTFECSAIFLGVPVSNTLACCRVFRKVEYIDKECPAVCDHPLPPTQGSLGDVRSETISQSAGFKKNNPGCNCCQKRVLIWDLGRYDELQSGGQTYHYFDFIDYALLQEYFEDEEIAVDHVTGGSPQQRYFYSGNPGFDPYGNAVENGFWTGDINDYGLIIYPFPVASEDLDGSSQPCPFCLQPDGATLVTAEQVPDHLYWGGTPDWWEDVATGAWEGRILFQSAHNSSQTPTASLGYASNVFLNTLSDVTGMTIDAGARDISSTSRTEPTVSNLLDITAGMTVAPSARAAPITGGDVVVTATHFVRTVPAWCVFQFGGTTVNNFASVSRNIVSKQQPITTVQGEETQEIARVEYLIATTRLYPFPSDSLAIKDSLKKFYLNLMQLPIGDPNA